jgi:GTP-dependent phosphoenolpyruvate carboxykinase
MRPKIILIMHSIIFLVNYFDKQNQYSNRSPYENFKVLTAVLMKIQVLLNIKSSAGTVADRSLLPLYSRLTKNTLDYQEDGSNTLLRNICIHLPIYTASYFKIPLTLFSRYL